MSDGQRDSNYVAFVEAENDQLRERVRQLEQDLGLRLEVPPIFSLTGRETTLAGLLMKREIVTKDFAMTYLYSDRPNDMPEEKIIDVYICKLRKKLSKFGIEIDTVWGRGYAFSVDAKAKFTEYLEAYRGSRAA